MATNKEAVAIILDICGVTRDQLTSYQGMVCNIITRRVISQSKDEIAVVICGSENTDNEMYSDDGDDYKHIVVVNGLQLPNVKHMCQAVKGTEPSGEAADVIEALIIAMDILKQQTKGRRGFKKRVLIFTSLMSPVMNSGIKKINQALIKEGIQVDIVGSHPNDHPHMNDVQKENQNVMEDLIEGVPGGQHQEKQALEALSLYETKEVQPRPWTCEWQIGNLSIPVAGYMKVREQKAASFKTCLCDDVDEEPAVVTSYHLNDEAHTEVEPEDTVRGYRYGGIVIPVNEADEKAMKYSVLSKCFQLLGFTSRNQVKMQHLVGDNTMIFVAGGSEEDSIAFSAVVNSMYVMNVCAVVRYAYRAGSQARLGLALPHIKSTYEGLIFNILPFKEDLRHYVFPPLTTKKDSEPSVDQLKAVDDLIDTMDLEASDVCGDEPFISTHIPNPYIQHLYQCIEHRLSDPHCDLPDVNPDLKDLIGFENIFLKKSEEAVAKIKGQFVLREVEEKEKKMNMFSAAGAGAAAAAGVSDGGGDEIISHHPVTTLTDLDNNEISEISEATAIKDFTTMVNYKDKERRRQAFHQLSDLINRKVIHSISDEDFTTITEYLQTMRRVCGEDGEVDMYNKLMKDIKQILFPHKRSLWEMIVSDDLLLLPSKAVSEEDLVAFKTWGNTKAQEEDKQNDEDMKAGADELLDEW